LIGDQLLSTLEVFPPLPADGPLPKEAQAIVILSAESLATSEFPALSPGVLTLQRLRYGAFLQRRTGLPILVAGGIQTGRSVSLAAMMRQSLIDDFQVPVTWLEELSQDTHQNATRSAAILKVEGITRIFLITHAWHMARAKLVFERAGMTVFPAPTIFVNATPDGDPSANDGVQDLLPSAKALQRSYFAFHEILGLAFYWIAYP
jgi:uncharacterized SAM-binding protein YcdF (DUF218 family)